jgi:hypothetical protein
MIAVLAGSMMFAPGLIPEARASHDWFAIGTAFRVGAAHISFVFGTPSYGYAPAYYYRYDRPIRYRGHQCSRSCFHDAGYYYHHESCPLVAVHFSSYRVDPYWAYDRYAPRYDGYRGRSYRGRYYDDGHRDHDRSDGRYDGRGRRGYQRDGRYDRHDDDDDGDRGRGRRGRGHRHHRGCGHH